MTNKYQQYGMGYFMVNVPNHNVCLCLETDGLTIQSGL